MRRATNNLIRTEIPAKSPQKSPSDGAYDIEHSGLEQPLLAGNGG